MFTQLLVAMRLDHYALSLLIAFASTFATILLWTYRKSGKPHYDKISRFPLE